MGPRIVGYENHISNQQAAYGTGMLTYVMIGSTIL